MPVSVMEHSSEHLESEDPADALSNHRAMRRVLMVAYYFPPTSTSGSMRPLGFCRHLWEFGWLARVLTTDPTSVNPPLSHDETLCNRVPQRVHVDRVPHANALRFLVDVRNRLKRRVVELQPSQGNIGARIGGQGDPSHGRRGRLSLLKDAVLERLFEFPDPQCGWRRPAVRQMRRLSGAQRPDLVLATGGPWTALLVGRSLARFFGVPLVTDFRDPWTRNPGNRATSRWSEQRARVLERAVCASSSRVIVNTPELGEQFAKDYPEFEHKFVTITNGFDTFEGEADVPPEPTLHEAGNSLELCHFGTVYGMRDPLPLLLALQRLAERDEISLNRVRVRFVGSWEVDDPSSNRVAEDLERRGLLSREPSIPYAACLRDMRRARALLILQPGSPLQIPGKIYEYLATGRPMLVIGGEGATAALVERHRLGLCCRNDTRTLEDVLRNLVSGQLRLDPPSLRDTACFHYRALTRQLAETLDARLSPNRARAATQSDMG
jgi:glycosyltransferase involved in cell wall biosynthesis